MRCRHMQCHQCEDVTVVALRAEVEWLREALKRCARIGEARVTQVVREALTADYEKPGPSTVTAGDLVGLKRMEEKP